MPAVDYVKRDDPAPQNVTVRLSIEGPSSIVEHKLIKCKALNAEDGAKLNWDVTSVGVGDDGNPEIVDVDMETINGELWFTGPPGKYLVKLWANGKAVTTAKKTINITESKRKPKPNPNPQPGPNPNPPNPDKVDSLYVVVIKDANNISPNVARVLGDTPFWDSLRPKHEWDFYDKTSQVAIQKNYVAAIGNTTIPALLLMDKTTGKVLKVVTLPNTTAEIKTLVDSYTK
jgi:hypothetical protein